MGNALVSELRSWTLRQWLWTGALGSIVLYAVAKFIFAKPWGIIRNYKRAIEQNDERRKRGFAEFEERVNSDDATVNEKREQILALSLLQLRDALQKDQYTAMEVLEAYIEKAMKIQKEINCCTEVVREAFDYARKADEKWSGKSDKPPLYGLPFSVKGNFHLEGYDCNIGLAKFLNQPKDADCSLVVHLKQIGAIPFVITNIPQGLISFVCSNSVYGTTKNPKDHSRSPGGSSGGEAALYAAGGSAFGIGSDLAGSLRIPASFCGVVSFKPTQDRFVVTHTHGGVPGRGRLGLSFGFYSTTVEEQMVLLECCVGTAAYRQLVPQTPPAPLRLEMIDPSKKLRFGYFENDGFADPVPAMRRSVIDTVEKLKAKGHEVVKFNVPDTKQMIDILYKNITPDNGEYLRWIYSHDVIDEHLTKFVMLLGLPRWLRRIGSHLIAPFSPQMGAISGATLGGLSDLRYNQELTDKYREKFVNYWKDLGIDALICPAFIVPAVPHHFPQDLTHAAAATALFNMIDFPAGVVPTGTVTKQDDQDLLDENIFPVGRNILLKAQREAAKNSEGLPCSVQIATLPYEEELCLHAMREVESVWSG